MRRNQATDQTTPEASQLAAQTDEVVLSAALLRLAEVIGGVLDLDRVLEAVVQIAPQLLGLTRCGLFLLDPAEKVLMPTKAWGLARELRSEFLALKGPPEIRAVVKAVESQEPVAVDAVNLDGWIPRKVVTAFDIGSMLIIPLMSGGRLMGVLALDTPGERHTFTPRQIAIARGVAAQAAVAIHNARLYAEADRRRKAAESLAEVGRVLSRSLDPEEVGQRIVDSTRELLSVSSAILYRLEPESENLAVLAVSRDIGPAIAQGVVLPRGAGTVGLAVLKRQTVNTSDFLTDPRIRLTPEVRARLEVLPYRAVLAVPLLVQGRVIGALGIGYQAGRMFSEEEIRLAEAFATEAAIALENARLYQRAEERAQKLKTLSALTRLISAAPDSRQVFNAVAEAATTLMGARLTRVWVADPEAAVLRTQGDFGLDPNFTHVVSEVSLIPYGVGLAGCVLESRMPEYVLDVQRDSRWLDPRLATEAGLHAYAGVPLVRGDQALGVLAILFGKRGPFTSEEKELMSLLADHAAIAIQNAQLFAQEQAARAGAEATTSRLRVLSRRLVEVQEAERRFVARELHDEIGQVLTGLKLTLEMCLRLPADSATASLRDAQALVNDLIGRARELSLDLRPSMLDDLGLLPTLKWHFDRYTARTGVRVAFSHTGLDRRLPRDVETATYRLLQEALTNVARHAGVRNATVSVRVGPDTLGLQVEDNGSGFDPGAVGNGATGGLSGMRERAVLLGGTLAIESAPGAGTRVTAQLPLGLVGKTEDGPHDDRAGR